MQLLDGVSWQQRAYLSGDWFHSNIDTLTAFCWPPWFDLAFFTAVMQAKPLIAPCHKNKVTVDKTQTSFILLSPQTKKDSKISYIRLFHQHLIFFYLYFLKYPSTGPWSQTMWWWFVCAWSLERESLSNTHKTHKLDYISVRRYLNDVHLNTLQDTSPWSWMIYCIIQISAKPVDIYNKNQDRPPLIHWWPPREEHSMIISCENANH